MCGHGLESHKALGNYLVSKFVNCKSVLDIDQLFKKLSYWNYYSWTYVIRGYAKAENIHHALNLQCQIIQEHHVYPSRYTCSALLLCRGEIYRKKATIIRNKDGIEIYIFMANTLVNIYANCGPLGKC